MASSPVRGHPAPSGALRRRRPSDERNGYRVREHPAPSGALRRTRRGLRCPIGRRVREHPAPSGALRRVLSSGEEVHFTYCQGASSTIRCIETSRRTSGSRASGAGQGAPSTIRCIETTPPFRRLPPGRGRVREYPAPSGALRRPWPYEDGRLYSCQGAPSTIRCIEARSCCPGASWAWCQGAEADRHRGGASCGRAVSTPPVPFCPEVRTQGPRIR